MKKTIRRMLCGVLAVSLGLALATPVTGYAQVKKIESVYVIANPDGSTKSITVSDQLQGAGAETGTLKDVSDLTDIKNVKGDEEFDQSGQNLTWNLNGADIFYQGKTEKELPVSVNIKYELDGTEMSAQDLVGKSGKLKITVGYENKTGKIENINGKDTKIVTPFLMATGLILSNEHFSNVNLDDGGKVIDDGSKSIVICVGMPGLMDSLNLSKKMKDKIGDKIKDEIVITCDTTDFEMKNTFTLASANLLNSIIGDDDEDSIIDMDEIDDKIEELDDAVEKLDDGANDVENGAKKLSNGTGKLAKGINKYVNDGVKKLTAGIKKLGENAPKLKKGVGKYVNGVDSFADGVKAYVNGSSQLTDGIKTLSSTLLSTDTSQLTELISGVEAFSQGIAAATNEDDLNKLSNGANSVSEGIGTVNSGLASLKDSYSNNDAVITGLETALAANQKVLEGLKAAKAGGAQGLDTAIATLEQTTAGEKTAIESLKKLTEGQKAGVDKLVTATSADGELRSGAESVANGVKTLTTGLISMSSNENVQKLKTGVAKITAMIPLLIAGVKKLQDGAVKLSANDKKLLAGADALKKAGNTMRSSIKKLGGGMTQLTEGAEKLESASNDVVKGADSLNKGTGKLFDGTKKLSDGFSKFRKKAVDKLLDFYQSDIRDLVDSLEETIDQGKEYKSFSGIDAGMDGEVKFIIETEAVKADDV
ncbi:MAG: hypothetical protein J5819_08065 [Eubacterium sp.]|nr:hypothetical protein [Eubacterium sp.]